MIEVCVCNLCATKCGVFSVIPVNYRVCKRVFTHICTCECARAVKCGDGYISIEVVTWSSLVWVQLVTIESAYEKPHLRRFPYPREKRARDVSIRWRMPPSHDPGVPMADLTVG